MPKAMTTFDIAQIMNLQDCAAQRLTVLWQISWYVKVVLWAMTSMYASRLLRDHH
jgi:hypothetical protein